MIFHVALKGVAKNTKENLRLFQQTIKFPQENIFHKIHKIHKGWTLGFPWPWSSGMIPPTAPDFVKFVNCVIFVKKFDFPYSCQRFC